MRLKRKKAVHCLDGHLRLQEICFGRFLNKKYPNDNDFGKEIIPNAARDGYNVQAYLFNDYWEDIGTMRSFFDANINLAADEPDFEFYDADSPIYTSPDICRRPRFKTAMLRTPSSRTVALFQIARWKMPSSVSDPTLVKTWRSRTPWLWAPIPTSPKSNVLRCLPKESPDRYRGRHRHKNAIIDKNARIGKNCKIINVNRIKEDRDKEGKHPTHGFRAIPSSRQARPFRTVPSSNNKKEFENANIH